VDLLGRYSNPDNVSRLNRILTGQGRDRPSHRSSKNRPDWPIRTSVLERYLAGETANDLADAFDVNRATVFAILQRAGIKSRYRVLTDDVAAATAMYQAGQSLTRIAEHFGVADGTVPNRFRRLGIPTRARGTNQWNAKPAQ